MRSLLRRRRMIVGAGVLTAATILVGVLCWYAPTQAQPPRPRRGPTGAAGAPQYVVFGQFFPERGQERQFQGAIQDVLRKHARKPGVVSAAVYEMIEGSQGSAQYLTVVTFADIEAFKASNKDPQLGEAAKQLERMCRRSKIRVVDVRSLRPAGSLGL